MARKLDIFRVLRAANLRQFRFYQGLNDEEKKEFILKIVLQFASTISSDMVAQEDHLIRVNERLNLYGDLMWKYPDLSYAMLASCGRGKVTKAVHMKAASPTVQDTVLLDFLAIHWPGINQDEAHILLSQMDKKAFDDLLQGTGLDAEREKKIAAAFKKRQATPNR